jgi:hypothetical protein
MTVRLGRRGPSWELTRWGRDVLGFSPLVDEGYSVRGDRRSLCYAGRKQSHRFTILDKQRFEYDIVLNREPESNRLCLALEGWEGFDFLRQPDEFGPEILRGSYAVYKKEGVINSPAYHVGTGKLCHIHRPKVIDARGRWAWGDISIDRGLMTLTVPEEWLGDAKYPVTVDPVVGSSTAGAYTRYNYISQEDYEWYLEEKAEDSSTLFERFVQSYPIELYESTVFNKYRTPAQLQGTYNTYLYVYDLLPPDSGEYAYTIFPFLYSDYNEPNNLLALNATVGNIMANLGSPSSFTPRWVQSTLAINGSVAANTDVWFGFFGNNGILPFDYGVPCLQSYDAIMYPEVLGDYSSLYEMAVDYGLDNISGCGYMFTGEDANVYPGARNDFKVSMYLGIPGSYARTLTQGATLTDSRKRAGNYKRSATQTAQGTAAAARVEGFCRGIAQTVTSVMTMKGPLALLRKLTQQAGAGAVFGRLLSMLRKPTQAAGAGDGTQRIAQAKRTLADTGKPGTAADRKQDFVRTVAQWGNAGTGIEKRAGYAKRFQETASNTDSIGVVLKAARRLVEAAAALYGLKAADGFDRRIADTAGVGAVAGGMMRFFRVLFGLGGSGDGAGRFVDRMRAIQDTETAGDAAGHAADYLRGLFIEAGALAENRHTARYKRDVADYADIEAASLRHLFVFIRLITGAYIRDFIIRRFLKSRAEAVIKSPVCREIHFDSALH